MKNLLIAVALIIVANFFLTPLQKDKISGSILFFMPDRVCFNYYKPLFKDPDSAYLVSSDKTGMPHNMSVSIAAKNSYGAYTTEQYDCKFSNGEIDKTEMLIEKLKRFNGEK